MHSPDKSLVFERQKGGQSAKSSGQAGCVPSVVTEEGRKCLGTLSGRLDGWWTGCELSGKTKDSQILTAGGRDCHLLT